MLENLSVGTVELRTCVCLFFYHFQEIVFMHISCQEQLGCIILAVDFICIHPLKILLNDKVISFFKRKIVLRGNIFKSSLKMYTGCRHGQMKNFL